MDIKINTYNDSLYRSQVVSLWTEVFGYTDARNKPGFSIDKKLKAGDGLFFVAEKENTVIGTIMAGYDGHRGWIYSLAVLPELRKQGIGSRLLKYAEEKLIGMGCCKINLQIIAGNELVKDFYLKNGYRIEERISMGKVIEELQ